MPFFLFYRWLVEIPATLAWARLLYFVAVDDTNDIAVATLGQEYHVYFGMTCGLTLEGVLKKATIEVTPENIREEVMVVYETQLKCGFRLPPSKFLLRMCKV